MEIEKYLSKEVQNIINFCKSKEDIYEISSENFIYSAIEMGDNMLYKCLNTFINSFMLDEIHVELIKMDKTSSNGFIKKHDENIKISKALNAYIVGTIKDLKRLINSSDILLTILKNEDDRVTKLFNKYGLNYEIFNNKKKELNDILFKIEENKSDLNKPLIVNSVNTKNNSKTSIIPYSVCLNDNKDLINTEIFGRDEEINDILDSLSLRKNNKVILVGDSGVGKTSIVEFLVNRIEHNSIPIEFRGKKVYKIDVSLLISGTYARGILETKVNDLIEKVKKNKDIILFIDDVDDLFLGDNNNVDNIFILTQLLKEVDIPLILVSSYKGYKKISDSNLNNFKNVKKVIIDDIDKEKCYDILNNRKKIYEDFHKVIYDESIIKKCVDLSEHYIVDKKLPSSALSILDELGSYKKNNNDIMKDIKSLSEKLNFLENQIEQETLNDSECDLSELDEEKKILRNQLSILEGKIRDEKLIVTLDDLYCVISKSSKVPISNIKTGDMNDLVNIDKKLKNIVIGQDEAIEVVSSSIKSNKIGLHKKNHTIGNFLFIGPSGTGKTLLAKTLAKEIFGNEKYLVRFDMSEYSDKTSITKLIGTGAGYIGYNNGGLLTEAVKNKKYCVLLLDEIEKADDEIYNLFLQVLDEGYLVDNKGEKVDFRNTLIILTSNIGTRKANNYKSLGFINRNDNTIKKDIIEKELKNKFQPEFINRLDNIIYFNYLNNDDIKKIIELELNYFRNELQDIGFDIDYGIEKEKVINFLFNSINEDINYGARPIKRVISEKLENKITDIILNNSLEKEHTFYVFFDEKNNFNIK